MGLKELNGKESGQMIHPSGIRGTRVNSISRRRAMEYSGWK